MRILEEALAPVTRIAQGPPLPARSHSFATMIHGNRISIGFFRFYKYIYRPISRFTVAAFRDIKHAQRALLNVAFGDLIGDTYPYFSPGLGLVVSPARLSTLR